MPSPSPLARSRSSFAFVLVLGMISCASEIRSPDPAEVAGTQASTIVVAPLNMALELSRELESSTQIVRNALIRHLEDNDKTVHPLEPRLAHSLWIKAAKEVRRGGGEQNFEAAANVFARLVGEQIEFDAMIIGSLYLQNGRVGPRDVRWDSARQTITFVGKSRWEVEMPSFSTVRAASIHVYVLDRRGNEIHSRRTGVELVQHMEIHSAKRQGRDKQTWALANDDPAIEDPIRVRAAIAHALSPFLRE